VEKKIGNRFRSTMNFYKNIGSPWMKRMSDAEKWLREQEAKGLDPDNIERPNTKWVFDSFFNVEVKVVLDREPLVGTGLLPDWRRNLAHSQLMVTLDTYQDNLCLWRCIEVHQGALPHRSTEDARSLAKSYLNLVKNLQMCQKRLLTNWIRLKGM